jgi:hypothetical protein
MSLNFCKCLKFVLSQRKSNKKSLYVLCFVWCLFLFTCLFIFDSWYMNKSVWFEKRLPWCLVELLLLKGPIPDFDLELHMLVLLCSMLKVGGFEFWKLSKNLVIKVSKTSFSKLRVRKKSYTKPIYFVCSTISVISMMSWARILLSWDF